jgi:uncharacterized protein YjbI with pentapeptide repeats
MFTADLEGANLSAAILTNARLANAQLDTANLGKADLTGANASHADMAECYLGGAKLDGADLTAANLRSSNLEEASLVGAKLDDADLNGVHGRNAKFSSASMVKVGLAKAQLAGADLSNADLRQATFTDAKVDSLVLTGAKVAGLIGTGTNWPSVTAEWVDASPTGTGTKRVPKANVLPQLTGQLVAATGGMKRYFGQGDVLRNASLSFDEGATVEIESRFEQCSITLGKGTELVVGRSGVLSGCQISGAGNITIHGQFFERESPGIVGPSQLVVSSRGSLVGAVEQTPELTRFGFEPGCKLRMRILQARTNGER